MLWWIELPVECESTSWNVAFRSQYDGLHLGDSKIDSKLECKQGPSSLRVQDLPL